MYSVSFSCSSHGGWGEMQGIVHLEEGRLRFQYQAGDAVLGLLRSSPKELVVELDALASAEFSAGWFWLWPVIELGFSDFVQASWLQSGTSGRVELSVAWRDRRRARLLAEALEQELAFGRQLRLERDIARLSQVDPRSAAQDAESGAAGESTASGRALRGLGSGRTSERHD